MRRRTFLGVGGATLVPAYSRADGSIASASPKANTSMNITRSGTQPSSAAPEAYFTGQV